MQPKCGGVFALYAHHQCTVTVSSLLHVRFDKAVVVDAVLHTM